jgi:hypothetical protein
MGLFDRNFLITTGVTAVICGAIFYYVNTRLRELELALAKQNQVLSSFISNVQQEFRLSSSRQMVSPSLASEEAIKFVEKLEKTHDKIEVSDNESESESESDSDDDSVSDLEDENDSQNKLIICNLSPQSDDIKIIELNTYITDTSVPTEDDDDDADVSDDESADSEADTEYEHVDDIHVDKLDLPLVSEAKVDSEAKVHSEAKVISDAKVHSEAKVVSDAKVDSEAKVNLNDLKVDDLRKLVLEQGLTSKEEVKKLKKNELLALLKK